MRATIERLLLIVMLVASYGLRAPGLIRQGTVGIPALAVGALIVVVMIALLLRASAGAALVLAIMAGLGIVLQLIGRLIVMPLMFHLPRPSLLEMTIPILFGMVAAFCALDLWSEWRKKANPESSVSAQYETGHLLNKPGAK